MDPTASPIPHLDGESLAKPTHLPKQAPQKPGPAPLRYFWEDGIFKPQQDLKDPPNQQKLPFKEAHLRGGMRDPDIGGVYIKFLIRSAADPTGSNSPCVNVDGDVLLRDVFTWYIANTYAHGGPFVGETAAVEEDYYLMRVDMARRTLGKKYYHVHAQQSPLRIMDTEWWAKAELTKICVVSSDRIPQGNYMPCESGQ